MHFSVGAFADLFLFLVDFFEVSLDVDPEQLDFPLFDFVFVGGEEFAVLFVFLKEQDLVGFAFELAFVEIHSDPAAFHVGLGLFGVFLFLQKQEFLRLNQIHLLYLFLVLVMHPEVTANDHVLFLVVAEGVLLPQVEKLEFSIEKAKLLTIHFNLNVLDLNLS